MDEHFRTAPLRKEPASPHGPDRVWNRNFLGCDSLAVLPYDQRLHRFPAYLQQLEMESNGKRITLDEQPLSTRTPVRSSGASRATTRSIRSFSCCTRARRALRSTSSRPSTVRVPYQQQQNLALANCFAQAEAFAFGQTEAADPCRARMRQGLRRRRSHAWFRTRCTRATVRAA